jgi:hypothetical protein
VVESLLDSVYQSEVTCISKYERARAVIDLAEKWDFHHVDKLVKRHFCNDKDDDSGLSLERFALAMAIQAKGPAIESMKTFDTSCWGPGGTASGDQNAFPTAVDRYLYDYPVPKLLAHRAIIGSMVSDLGTWNYHTFLELPPTTTWAILRARHLATTVPCEVDGEKFQAEFAKLLDIIMPVSTSVAIVIVYYG